MDSADELSGESEVCFEVVWEVVESECVGYVDVAGSEGVGCVDVVEAEGVWRVEGAWGVDAEEDV